MASRKGSRPPERRRPYDSNNDRDRPPRRTFDSRSQPGIVPTPHCNRCVLMGTTSDCDYRQKFQVGMGMCTRCFTAGKLCHNSNEHRRQRDTPRDTLNVAADTRGTEQRRGRDATGVSDVPQGDRSRRRVDHPRSRSPVRHSRSPSYRNRNRNHSTSRLQNRDCDDMQSAEVPEAARGLAENDKAQQACTYYPEGTCRKGERCTFQHIGPAPAISASHDADRTTSIGPADTHGDTRTPAYPEFNRAASSDLGASIRDVLLRLGYSEDKVDNAMSLDSRTRAPDDHSAQLQGYQQSRQSLQPQQNLAPRQHMQHARPGQYTMPHLYSTEQEQPLWQSATPQAQAQLQRHSVGFGVPPNSRLRSIGQEQPHPDSALHDGGTADHHLSPRVRRSRDSDDFESTPIKREDDDDIWAVNE